MGQYDILEYLKKNKGKWFNAKEIAKKLKINPSTATISCMKLRKFKLVKWKQIINMKGMQGRRKIYVYSV